MLRHYGVFNSNEFSQRPFSSRGSDSPRRFGRSTDQGNSTLQDTNMAPKKVGV